MLAKRRKTVGETQMSGIDVVRVAGGKISEFWYGEHLLELMQQLGAVPDFAAGSRARDER
jgi:hypothetical protein